MTSASADHASRPDPRPLVGEPLSIDLLNTRWRDAGTAHDMLDTVDGFAQWLATPTVRHSLGGAATGADTVARENVLRARDAIAAVVAAPREAAAPAAFEAVLAHGRTRHHLDADGPSTTAEVDDPTWLAAWLAAEDHLRLLGDRPDRIRACAGPECVLHFYDVSKNGTRRWCSMAGCGNRAKASRHYARHGGG